MNLNTVYVAGGLGYVGYQVVKGLVANDHVKQIKIIDLDLYGVEQEYLRRMNSPKVSVRKVDACVGPWNPEVSDKDALKIFLPQPHLEPELLTQDQLRAWTACHQRFLDAIPRLPRPFIVFSSARVLTSNSVYAQAKRSLERIVAGQPGCLALRLGTVYGGFDSPVVRPTVPNRALLTGELPDDLYQAWITGAHWVRMWFRLLRPDAPMIGVTEQLSNWRATRADLEKLCAPSNLLREESVDSITAAADRLNDFDPTRVFATHYNLPMPGGKESHGR